MIQGKPDIANRSKLNNYFLNEIITNNIYNNTLLLMQVIALIIYMNK